MFAELKMTMMLDHTEQIFRQDNEQKGSQSLSLSRAGHRD